MTAKERQIPQGLSFEEFLVYIKEHDVRPDIVVPDLTDGVVAVDGTIGDGLTITLEDDGNEVVATSSDYPPDWEFRRGDPVGVERLNDSWKVVPFMASVEGAKGKRRFFVGQGRGRRPRLLHDEQGGRRRGGPTHRRK